jgi:hypothetical protein
VIGLVSGGDDGTELLDALHPALQYVADRLEEGRAFAKHEALQHPIGFHKYRIGTLPFSTFSVRAHVWPRAVSSSPHQHRWPLATVVCAGWVSNALFDAIPSRDGDWTAHSFETRYADMTHSVEPLADKWALTRRPHGEKTDDPARFFTAAGEVHAAQCTRAPAVTISVTAQPTGPGSIYFAPRGADASRVEAGFRPFRSIPPSVLKADCSFILRAVHSHLGR